jgi:hypothetical protein
MNLRIEVIVARPPSQAPQTLEQGPALNLCSRRAGPRSVLLIRRQKANPVEVATGNWIRSCGWVRTSQETHYVPAMEPNRLMLFRETVGVYCESHTERLDDI